ncbi:MAG: histidine kinase [Lachnospiraceae bacterium]|nr:histidine kinase [Lachnospiraceae bacterium]
MKRVSFQRTLMKQSITGYLILLAALLLYSFSQTVSYGKSLYESNRRVFHLYLEEIKQATIESEVFIHNLYNNNAYTGLAVSTDVLKKYSYAYDIRQIFQIQMNYENGMEGLFLLYEGGEKCYYSFRADAPYLDIRVIRDQIRSEVAENTWISGWRVIRGEERSYLVYLGGRKNGVYAAVVVDFDGVTNDIMNRYQVEEAGIVFTSEEGVVSNEELAVAAGIEAERDFAIYESYPWYQILIEPYYVYASEVNQTGIRMLMVVPNGNVFLKQYSQLLLLVIIVCCIGIILVVRHSMKKNIVRPLALLMGTMNEIKGGDMEAKACQAGELEDTGESGYLIEEFEEVNQTFNEMVEQIKNLRLVAYEEEINRQKAQLRYLQLQVNPHFFLNCLKVLYALSQKGNIEQLQDTIIATSRHFRYIFKNNSQTVLLEEELRFSENYIALIAAGGSVKAGYEVSVDPEARNCSVPPLVVQTFVENSVKYADVFANVSTSLKKKTVEIRVEVVCLENEKGRFLDIRVRDNGAGYQPELLEQLNNREINLEVSEHVGIENLKARCRLLFGEEAECFFMNQGGAVSEVILPARVLS